MTDELRESMLQIENAYGELADEKGYLRYLQTELTSGVDAYENTWGEELYGEFRQVKESFDPQHLSGRGQVFSFP